MSGGTFVKSIVIWLMSLILGVVVAIVPVASGNLGVWWLMVCFSAVWVPLTLRWAWLAGMDIEKQKRWEARLCDY